MIIAKVETSSCNAKPIFYCAGGDVANATKEVVNIPYVTDRETAFVANLTK